jgi:hypothetical protein
VTSAQRLADERFVAASEDRNLSRRAIKFKRQCQRTLELMAAYPEGRTAHFIRDILGMSGDRINRVLESLIEKGDVVRTEDRPVDRRRPIVTYSRVQVMDFSEAAIKAGRLPDPDPKFYDIGTGQFVDRKASQDVAGRRQPPAAAAGGTSGSPAGTLSATETSPLADKPPVPPIPSESGRDKSRDTGHMSGRDTFVERDEAGNYVSAVAS